MTVDNVGEGEANIVDVDLAVQFTEVFVKEADNVSILLDLLEVRQSLIN